MLLHDIGKSPVSVFKKINEHLETNFGFKISESTSDKDIVLIIETLDEEISELKIKGEDAKTSPEITKRLLVLEGLKTLREFALVSLQSPKLEPVCKSLCDFVVDTFEITGMCQADFDAAIQRAMDEYRSSRYRFPDDYIEQRVRQEALARLRPNPSLASPVGHVMEGQAEEEAEIDENSDAWGREAKRSSPLSGYHADTLDSPGATKALSALSNPNLSLAPPEKEEPVPMVRGKDGRLMPDPWAAQAAARKKGIVMKENLVKRLRTLLETEVSQAEVMMAAKGFAKELQEMIEKIGRLQNEDLPPVTDKMRETYGVEAATAFQSQIYGAFQAVMDSLYTAKDQADDAVSNMAETGTFSASVDMEKDPGLGAEMDAEVSADFDAGADLDNIEADLETDADDEFGAAAEEEPLGRAMKEESVEHLQRKVLEMKKLVERAKKLQEARRSQ